MRLNGLGAPDEVTLVPLNKVEPAPPKTEPKQVDNTTQKTKKGYCFYCNIFGPYKAECRKMKRDKWQQTGKNNGQTNHSAGRLLTCDTCGKPHKTEDYVVGMEPTLPTIRDLSVTLHKNERRITPSNQRQLHLSTTQKTNYAEPALRGNSRREGVFNGRSLTKYAYDTTIVCNGTSSEDWLRRQAIASIRKQHPQIEQGKTYAQDKDYRDDHKQHMNFPD